ncbi:MAG: Type 1 glutamine amidotransferase-like domain-containing protein [Clostridiales bacterium]|nr:Type 1 glutamine amidotransferase-like domain-containing protein [Clostridiales bacterium]
MLLLCSNGLSSEPLRKCISDKVNCGTAVIIVTADNEYKGNNYHVPRCKEELESLGCSVDLFDIDIQPIDQLLKYDIVEFIGGNPYYLLQSLKKCHARKVLSMIAADKILIGWSAGALVMGPTIRLIEEYSPEMNICKLDNLEGMCLTDVQILPHYSKFIDRYENCEERCIRYEQEQGCSVIRLNDGEGVLIDEHITLIG